MPRPRVHIAHCEGYGAAGVEAAVARGLAAVPHAFGRRVVAKANWVFADAQVARSCYTRPELARGVLERCFAERPDAHVTFIGNAGAGMPTAVAARHACGEAAEYQGRGFFAFPRLYEGRVRLEPTDEGRLASFVLSLGPRLTPDERHDWRLEPSPHARYWRRITTSALLADADTLLFLPKLKTNVLSHGFTGACKLGGIGLLLDEDRMDGHNFHNDRRIADMLEIARPDLVISDGIEIAFGGNQMTQRGRRLDIAIVADNPVAHDVVACHILGRDPREVAHVRLSAERGWGPLALDDIDLTTEVPLETLQARVASFGHHGGIDVARFPEKFREETGWDLPLEIISGLPYEHAGAQGVLLDWLYFSYDLPLRRRGMAAWPRAAFVIGEFERLPSDPHALIYVIGQRACRRFEQMFEITGRVRVPSFVRDLLCGPAAWVAYRRHDGGQGWAVFFEGDPPTHRDLIIGIAIASGGRMLAPFFRLDLIVDSYLRMLGTQLRRWMRNRGPLPEVQATDIVRMQRFRPDAVEGATETHTPTV